MKYIIVVFLWLPLFAKSTFISEIEYASQFYKNPRGIGCHHCHGDKGEGRLIAKYKHNEEEKEFRGPNIKDLSYEKFYYELNKRKRGMPRYFLTKKEVEALYFYLKEAKD